MKTVAAVFSTMQEAEHVSRHLKNLGIPSEDINVVAGNDSARHDEYVAEAKKQETGTGAAAASAASFGGGVGIVASLVALAIPGVGPIIAGGALATVIAGAGIGAAAGGLVGAFSNLGISHDEAKIYEEAVRRGSVFVGVHVDDPMESEVLRVMAQHGARSISDAAEEWRASGWEHPYPSDSSIVATPMPGDDDEPSAKSRVRVYDYLPPV